ncbi:MAG TPA: cation-transporting P-type ATPase, partial [Gaiellaceae bacterium]
MATEISTQETAGDQPVWHMLEAAEATSRLDVDPQRGLTAAEAAARLERYGPNKFAEATPEPRWRSFVRQYGDAMQIVLLVVG